MKKVLLVDDDIDDRELFEEAIELAGSSFQCLLAADAPTALRLMKEHMPDLVFLDINLPVVSGWECLNIIRNNELYKDIPVIIYTTSSHERDKQIARDLGANLFVTKPHNFEVLADVVKQLINANYAEAEFAE